MLPPLAIAAFVGSGSAQSTPKTKRGIAARSSQVKRVVKDNNLELATQRKSQVPAGLVLKTIPAGKYAIFQTDQGPAGQVVPAAWQKIADSEDKGELGYTRTYKADYELFDGQAMDPQNLQAELHFGVK